MTHARRLELVGALLGLGAPVGLLLLRLARGMEGWPWRDLSADPFLYVYVTLGTVMVMAIFGRTLGIQEDRLERLSLTDALTGLWNRRHFDLRLAEEVSRAERYETPLALVVIDVDRFKDVNDRYGHRAGDRVLRRIAEVVRAEFRKSDVVCRYGGEEFSVIAPLTTPAEAERLAERARIAVSAAAMPVIQGTRVTISVGIAATEGGVTDTEELILRADGALYAAKAAGRNRTRTAPEKPEPTANATIH